MVKSNQIKHLGQSEKSQIKKIQDRITTSSRQSNISTNRQGFQLFADPSIVQTQSSDITLSFYLSIKVDAGGYIRISFPNSPSTITVTQSPQNCSEQGNNLVFTSCTSNVNENYIQLVVQNPINLDESTLQSSTFSVIVQNAINLPMTNQSVQITLSTSAAEVIEYTFRADVGTLTNTSITPLLDVVGANTNLNILLITSHIIPQGGIIVLQLSQYWNQGTLSNNNIDFFSSLSCNSLTIAGTVVQDGTYHCVMIDDFNVQIQGALSSGEVLAGSLIQFQIVGFTNPIQTNVSYNLFTVYTTSEDTTQFIDITQVNYVVTQPAQITNGIFSVSPSQKTMIGVVQENNIMQIQFISPVPLTKGCLVSYWFPTQFYNADQITSIQTGDFFGKPGTSLTKGKVASKSNFIVQNESGGLFKSVNFQSCLTFRDQIRETSQIFGLSQPLSTQTTISLQIYIKDTIGNTIVYSNSGLVFTPLPGLLTVQQASLIPNQVSNLSSVLLNVTPSHSLYVAYFPLISVQFPINFQVQNICQVSNLQTTQGLCVSNTIQNSIIIKNFLSQDLKGGQNLIIQFGLVKLPSTVHIDSQGKILIATFQQNAANSTDMYKIDSFLGLSSQFFTINPGNFIQAQVYSSSHISNDKSDYTFVITPYDQIPQYGFITIEYPSQVNIEDASISQQMCSNWSQSFPSSSAICTIYTSNNTIIISKGFQSSAGGAGQSTIYSWTVPFFTNPSTLIQSDSFVISTYDLNFNLIDIINSSVSIQMSQPAQIEEAQLQLDSYVNSNITNYSFQLTPSVQINQNNLIVITFPSQIIINQNNYQCSSLILKNIVCSQSINNSISVQFQLNQPIQKLQTFSFKINGIQNPNSTQPTAAIQVEIYDKTNSNIVINEDKKSLIVITNQASNNINANAQIISSVKAAGFPSIFTISLSLSRTIHQNGGIIIQYPPEVQKDPQQNVSAQVDATQYGYPQILDLPNIDLSSQQIQFSEDNFKQDIIVDQSDQNKQIVIKIQGLMNPFNGQISESFKVTTFDQQQNVMYLIEQVSSGLTIAGLCSYPCQTCLSSSSTMCTSCYQNSTKPLLQLNTCVNTCSDGRYYDKNLQRCMPCSQNCLTCQNSASNCLTCGDKLENLLKINYCVRDCGNGYINDYVNHKCQPCKKGCLQCSKNVNNCTVCDVNGTIPYFFNFDCYSQCPADVSIQIKGGNASYICQNCDSNCKTCQQSIIQCTSCQDYMKFDPLHQKCLDACYPNTQIYNTQNGNCDQCQQNCQTCVGDINTCTSCKNGFVLNQDSTCRESCKGSKNQAAVNQVCQTCQQPCMTCDGLTNSCTSCLFDLLLYDSTCVDHCPDFFEPNNATINQCIRVGLICPDGFHVNSAGIGCVPNTFECEPGYMINDKNTACIPVPGTPVPFPFLILAICMIIVVSGSFLKEKVQTKFYTCLIFLIGSMEIIQYFSMAVVSSKLDSVIPTLLSILGLIMQIVSNLWFTNKFRKNQLSDKLFTDWIRIHPKTNIFILLISATVNFKLVRIVFSGFYGIESTLAEFSHPQRTIHKTLKKVSYFQYLFVYLPIFIADFLIFGTVKWGENQILITSTETFILQLFILFITFREFSDIEKMYQPVYIHYSSLKPFQKDSKNQIQNESQIEDDGINEKQLIRKDMTTRKLEIELRKQALTQVIKQVGKNFLENKNEQFETGQEIKNVYTKFNIEKIKLRRAFSMENLQYGQTILTTDGTKADELFDDENSQSDLVNSNDSRYHFLNQKKRFSIPFNHYFNYEIKKDLDFIDEVDKIKEAFLEEKYKDNCYSEVKNDQRQMRSSHVHIRKKKMINRRTQTYLRELLNQGDELMDSDFEVNMENEIEIEQDYAQGLINNVIDAISQSTIEKNIIQNRKLRMQKQKDIPEFELKDIMGDFDIDAFGNNIFLEGDNGQQQDKQNRNVNKRGYLCDNFGNVINLNGQIVFKKAELDQDDEIPATYVFEKRKENFILMQDNLSQFRVNDFGQGAGRDTKNDISSKDQNPFIDSDNELVEKELKAFKHGIKQKGLSSNSDNIESQSRGQSLGEQLFLIDDNENIDDIINKITRKINPVKKSKMRNNSATKKQKKNQKKSLLGIINVGSAKTFGNDLMFETGEKNIQKNQKKQ